MDKAAQKHYTALRIFYFCFYASVATMAPYVYLYFKKIGLTGTEIGAIAAAGPLIVLIGQPLWGVVADKTQRARSLLSLATIITMISSLLYLGFTNFWPLICVSILFTFFSTPIIPLTDTATLEFVKQHQLSYGKIRFWGSFGFAAIVIIIGKITQSFGLILIFPIYASVMLLIFILSFEIPKYKTHFQFNFRGGIVALMQNNRYVLFLIGVFLLTATSSANVVYFGIFIDQLGGTTTLLGFAWMIAALSEGMIFLFSHKILGRVTPLQCLIAAAGGSVLRWLLYTIIHNPIVLVFLQPLHALTFGCYYLGSIHFVKQESPPGWMATGQTIFWAIGYGLSAIAGNFIGGMIYQKYNSVVAVYGISSLVALISMILFIVAANLKSKKSIEC
jgi:PPP family 3-phenylpropionic acid transporter